VAFYDISRGLSFLDPAMEREFNKITANEAIGLKRVLPSKIFPYIDIALKSTKMFLFIEHAEKIFLREIRLPCHWRKEWRLFGLRVVK